MSEFAIKDGKPSAPGKFVVRRRGLLVREPGGLPLLFDKESEAQKLIDQLAA